MGISSGVVSLFTQLNAEGFLAGCPSLPDFDGLRTQSKQDLGLL